MLYSNILKLIRTGLNDMFNLKKILTLLILVSLMNVGQAQGNETEKAFILFEEKKYEQSFPIMLKLAKDGNPKAQGTIARMYGRGWGTEKNEKEAFYWASLGALKNDPASQNVIGVMYQHGVGSVKKDLNEAITWLEKAANQGYVLAISNLVTVYEEKKDIEKQIYWLTKKFEIGDKSAALAISNLYDENNQLPGYQEKSFEWAMKGALAGDAKSIEEIADAYRFSLKGQKENIDEAINWYKKTANNSAYSNVQLGLIYYELYEKNKTKQNKEKVEEYLTKAADLGDDRAKYLLTKSYLFGKDFTDINKIKGYKLLKELHDSRKNFYAFEIESKIYGEGLDRPRNKQKSILYALKGMKIEFDNKDDSLIKEFGLNTGNVVINNDFFVDINLPEIYDLAWNRFQMGYEGKYSEPYKKYRSSFSPTVIEQSEKIKFNELLDKTIKHLEERREKFGPIEADDLINEGWRQFLGTRGVVNEPLAQLLTEEGLRLSIRLGEKNFIDTAKNNLGAIFASAANKNIRNDRLANIHLFDGQDSKWGPDNLLWSHYEGKINLNEKNFENLKARYLKRNKKSHLSTELPQLPNDAKNDYKKLIEFYKSLYKSGNIDLAKQIAFTYETNASSKEDYAQAIEWMSLTDEKSREERLKKIYANNFEASMPNFNGTIYQLFEVDLVEFRGGLLTNLLSAISPNQYKPLPDKPNRKLSLHALIIGNADYKGKPLKNSLNDAQAIAQKFRKYGFSVTEANNLDRKKFRDILINFTESAKNSDVTVFYYAGHGMQLGGINYLLPTDIDFSKSESIVTYDGLSLNDIKNRNLPGSTRLIFLDACRNNPFDSKIRGDLSIGLAPVNVGTGTLISFATRDGSVALDSVGGKHSPYTESLIKNLDMNEDIELMLRSVGDEVMRLTKNKQEPWKYGALSGQKIIIPTLANK